MTTRNGFALEVVVDKASWFTSAAKGTAAAVLLMVATLSLAAAAQIPDCEAGKLSDYEKLGEQGCVIGDLAFSNFRYHQAADGLPDDSISVTPGTVPGSDDPGLLLEAAWVAPSSAGSFVSYTVTVQPKGKPISGATLEMQFGQITGTGEASVVAELCPPASTPDVCGAGELKLRVGVGASLAKKAVDIGQLYQPLREVRVIHPLSMVTGKDGTASLNGFMTVFHASAALSAAGDRTALASREAGQ